MNSLILSMFLAILTPFIVGLMNVISKYVVSVKVKDVLSFTLISGFTTLIIGLIIASFLDWTGTTFHGVLFPALAGILMGLNYYLYFWMMRLEDASNVMGFNYFYPVVVALLSAFFLNEVLSIYSYIGMMLIFTGVVMLTIRMHKIKFIVALWMIVTMMIISALYRFFIKLATTNLPQFNGIAVNSLFIGLTMIPLLFSSSVRKGIKYELRNFKWALLCEILTVSSIVCMYVAMKNLSVTFVSAISAMQPLAIILIEKLFGVFGLKVVRDEKFIHKLIPMCLIVAGIILMYVFIK